MQPSCPPQRPRPRHRWSRARRTDYIRRETKFCEGIRVDSEGDCVPLLRSLRRRSRRKLQLYLRGRVRAPRPLPLRRFRFRACARHFFVMVVFLTRFNIFIHSEREEEKHCKHIIALGIMCTCLLAYPEEPPSLVEDRLRPLRKRNRHFNTRKMKKYGMLEDNVQFYDYGDILLAAQTPHNDANAELKVATVADKRSAATVALTKAQKQEKAADKKRKDDEKRQKLLESEQKAARESLPPHMQPRPYVKPGSRAMRRQCAKLASGGSSAASWRDTNAHIQQFDRGVKRKR